MTDVSLNKNDETSGQTMPDSTLELQEKEKSDTQKRVHGSLKNNATGGDVQVNAFLIEITGLEEDAPSSLKRRKITNVKRQHSSVGNNGSDHGLQEAIVSTNTCLEREFFKKDGVLKTYQRRHKRPSCSIKGSPRPCEEHMGSLMHIIQNSSMGETSMNDSDEVLTGMPLRIKLSGHMGCGIPGPGPGPGQVEEPEEHPEAPSNCLSVEHAFENKRDETEMMHIVWNSSMGETSVNLSDEALKLSGGMGCGISESGRVGKLEGWTKVPANCSVEPVPENRNEITEMIHFVLNSSAGETSLNHSGEAPTSGPSGIKLSGDLGCGIPGSGQAEVPANCLSVERAVGNRNMGRGMNLEENVKEHLIHKDEDMGCGISGSGLVGELDGQAEFPANCLSVECAVENRNMGKGMNLEDTIKENFIQKDEDMGCGISGSGQVGEQEVPANCLSVECAVEKGNKEKGMNLEGTVKENLIQKDVSALDLPQLYSEKVSGVKENQVKILSGDSTSPTDHVNGFATFDKNKCSDDLSSFDVVCKHLRQRNGAIETMSGIYCFSSNLDLLEDDNQVFVVQKDDSPQMSHPSSEVYLSGDSRRKLLILDVNGLLADIVSNIFEDYSTSITIGKKLVFKRPFVDDFMQFCFEKFNVGIWTSRTRRNLDMFLDVLMGDFKKQLLFIWDQWHCTDTGRFTIENTKPLFLKELKKL